LTQSKPDDILEGTTRRVFRYVYRQHNPVGIHDIQRGLGFSSPSLAHYHVSKLLKAGLLREEGEGYAVNKIVFENMIRLRKTTFPLQAAYATFFLAAMIVLLTVMRPESLFSSYVFGVVVAATGFAIAAFEAHKAARTPY
jgi:hypothetical protein